MLRWDLVLVFALVAAGSSVVSNVRAQDSRTLDPTQPADINRPAGANFMVPAASTAPGRSEPNLMARPNALLDEYRALELHTRFSFWSGQEVYRADKSVELGYFGGGSQDIFAGSTRALESISAFRTLRIAGTTSYVVGLGLLVADLVLLANGSSSVVGKNTRGEINSVKPLYWGLLLPGTVLGLSGAIAMQGANAYLSDAIDEYNADLANRLKGGVANSSPTRSFGLGIRSAF
jgi:hypothetical protein